MIAEINETLSLSNEPGLILNGSLDTLMAVMKVEGCWLQTPGGPGLKLAASRGLNTDIRAEISALRPESQLGEAILGQGRTIVIPDLSYDGKYGLDTFRQSGFRWLVAVPLMTHKAQGILGAASTRRRSFDKDLPDLVRTVGGLIGGALVKSRMAQSAPRKRKPADTTLKPKATPERKKQIPPTPPDPEFLNHHRRMASFRKRHR